MGVKTCQVVYCIDQHFHSNTSTSTLLSKSPFLWCNSTIICVITHLKHYKHKHTTKTNTKEPVPVQLGKLLSFWVLSELLCKHEQELKNSRNKDEYRTAPWSPACFLCIFCFQFCKQENNSGNTNTRQRQIPHGSFSYLTMTISFAVDVFGWYLIKKWTVVHTQKGDLYILRFTVTTQ